MISRFMAEPDREAMREERATIVDFDPSSRSYRVNWRGCVAGPVWSANGILHAPGASVTVLVKGGLLLKVVP